MPAFGTWEWIGLVAVAWLANFAVMVTLLDRSRQKLGWGPFVPFSLILLPALPLFVVMLVWRLVAGRRGG